MEDGESSERGGGLGHASQDEGFVEDADAAGEVDWFTGEQLGIAAGVDGAGSGWADAVRLADAEA